jgi:isopenicillin-N epimerase
MDVRFRGGNSRRDSAVGSGVGASTGAPARFGRHLREQWALDPRIIYLNHGTVGAPPRRVLEAQQRIRDEMELQPSRFLLRELTAIAAGANPPAIPRMRAAAARVAEFVGSRAGDLVFVDNATTGANAVLRSFDFRPGDEILMLDGCYGAVLNAARYVARRSQAEVRVVELPYPLEGPEAIVSVFTAGIGPKTRLAVIDHIMSESALLLPVAEIAAACRARGVPVLVDGAHAPGAIALDIPSLGVDWYTGNLHKWAMSPHTSAILWTSPERQEDLHPVVISWGLDQGFTTEFDLVGTRDPSAHLASPEGIDFMRELGVREMQAYNHALAWEAGELLTRRLGTSIGKPERMVGTMVTVPLPERAGRTRDQANLLRDALLFEDQIEIQMHAWRDRLWARVSAQVYNDLRDVERLAEALAART